MVAITIKFVYVIIDVLLIKSLLILPANTVIAVTFKNE